MERFTSGLVAVGLLMCGLGADALRTEASAHAAATESYEDIYYLPPPAWLPTLSLGHREALADLGWLQALIYFGVEFGQGGEIRHAFNYADAILILDPGFKRVYHWIGMAGMYRPGEVSVEDIERSVAYLERGTELFPDDGELAWDAGASLAYELVPRAAPEDRDALRARATEHMMVAARLGAGPDWLALVNATALQNLGELEQAARHLEEMYAAVEDESTRARIENRLNQLRSRAHTEALRLTLERFDAQRAVDFPYLPFELYLLVGPRGVVDEAALLEARFLPETSLEAGD